MEFVSVRKKLHFSLFTSIMYSKVIPTANILAKHSATAHTDSQFVIVCVYWVCVYFYRADLKIPGPQKHERGCFGILKLTLIVFSHDERTYFI